MINIDEINCEPTTEKLLQAMRDSGMKLITANGDLVDIPEDIQERTMRLCKDSYAYAVDYTVYVPCLDSYYAAELKVTDCGYAELIEI
jgi:hypothetical protein